LIPIRNIEIKNFKSIQHAAIKDCKRVNVLIGYPNVGKSNILEALAFFSVEEETKHLDDFVRLGKLTTLFHNGHVDESFQIIVNNNVRTSGSYKKESLDIIFDVNFKNDGFEKFDERLAPRTSPFELPIKEGAIIRDFSVKQGDSLSEHLVQGYRQNVGRSSIPVFQQEIAYSDLGHDFTNVDVLKYKFKENIEPKAGSAWRLQAPFGENIFEVISTKEALRNEIIEVLKAYNLDFLYDIEEQKYKLLKFIDKGTIFTMPYFMIADTLQRLFFYQAAIASNKSTVLLFEEPEAHMFSPYISKFTADIIHDENNNQFFLTTHSPFVLNDLMEELKEDQLAIYAVGYKKEAGETMVRKMTDDEISDIYQYGIDVFFNLENYLKDAF
jgi:AAA15 family ATPase/GTPase